MTKIVRNSLGYPVGPNDWVSSCCGARVSVIKPNTRVSHPGKGIRIFPDKVGKEMDNGRVCVSHADLS